jgi:hypothetical protein
MLVLCELLFLFTYLESLNEEGHIFNDGVNYKRRKEIHKDDEDFLYNVRDTICSENLCSRA